MDKAKQDLWDNLARIWGAKTHLRTELMSGRDVLQRQRQHRKDNFALIVCQELTPGPDQHLTWIVVEPTKDCTIELNSPNIWSGLSSADFILSISPDGKLEIGKVSLISGMPTSLYSAWQQTDQLFDGRLAKLLEAKVPGLSGKLKSDAALA